MSALRVVGIIIAGVVAAVLTQSASAADYVIIAASNAAGALAPGKVLGSGERVVLPAGARLTLMARSGRVLKLKGPYNAELKQAGKAGSGLTAVARVFSKSRASTTVGATRAASSASPARSIAPTGDPWVVEPARGGSACLRSGTARLWRHGARTKAEVAVWPPAGAPTRFYLQPGAHEMTVAAKHVVAGMQLFYKAGKSSKAVVISVLPASIRPDDKAAVLLWMADKGCSYQARRLAAVIHRE